MKRSESIALLVYLSHTPRSLSRKHSSISRVDALAIQREADVGLRARLHIEAVGSRADQGRIARHELEGAVSRPRVGVGYSLARLAVDADVDVEGARDHRGRDRGRRDPAAHQLVGVGVNQVDLDPLGHAAQAGGAVPHADPVVRAGDQHELPQLVEGHLLGQRREGLDAAGEGVPADDEVGGDGLAGGGVHVQAQPGVHTDVPQLLEDGLVRILVEQHVELAVAREGRHAVLDPDLRVGAGSVGALLPLDHHPVEAQVYRVDEQCRLWRPRAEEVEVAHVLLPEGDAFRVDGHPDARLRAVVDQLHASPQYFALTSAEGEAAMDHLPPRMHVDLQQRHHLAVRVRTERDGHHPVVLRLGLQLKHRKGNADSLQREEAYLVPLALRRLGVQVHHVCLDLLRRTASGAGWHVLAQEGPLGRAGHDAHVGVVQLDAEVVFVVERVLEGELEPLGLAEAGEHVHVVREALRQQGPHHLLLAALAVPTEQAERLHLIAETGRDEAPLDAAFRVLQQLPCQRRALPLRKEAVAQPRALQLLHLSPAHAVLARLGPARSLSSVETQAQLHEAQHKVGADDGARALGVVALEDGLYVRRRQSPTTLFQAHQAAELLLRCPDIWVGTEFIGFGAGVGIIIGGRRDTFATEEAEESRQADAAVAVVFEVAEQGADPLLHVSHVHVEAVGEDAVLVDLLESTKHLFGGDAATGVRRKRHVLLGVFLAVRKRRAPPPAQESREELPIGEILARSEDVVRSCAIVALAFVLRGRPCCLPGRPVRPSPVVPVEELVDIHRAVAVFVHVGDDFLRLVIRDVADADLAQAAQEDVLAHGFRAVAKAAKARVYRGAGLLHQLQRVVQLLGDALGIRGHEARWRPVPLPRVASALVPLLELLQVDEAGAVAI
eukprot:scaffold1661_cov251-Pinguiococcus_pyrenoidosus.AAC.8